MFELLTQGILIGLSIAAPVGPIGILCIQRTLRAGITAGLLSGLGAALADAIYGVIAGFGLIAISQFLLKYKFWIHLLGGCFLLYLGIRTFFRAATTNTVHDKANSLWKDLISTFLLTLSNPMTILSFIAIYATLGVVDHSGDYKNAWSIVAGVFIGSLLWWFFLSTLVSSIRHKLSKTSLKWINWLSGLILILFGVYAFYSAFFILIYKNVTIS